MPLQATSGAASYDAFGGGVAAVPNYIEECFSAFLYTGNGSTQTITNGIDLAGKGGLVWIKKRNEIDNHFLFDTNRGATFRLISNATNASSDAGDSLVAFNSNGFNLDGGYTCNGSGNTLTSWTFRKQPKFFDVVTYTGNGTNGRTVAHSLGSVPGCIIVKRTDATNGWAVYHRAMNASPQDYMMRLNATDGAFTTTPSRWNNTLPTSTEFTLSGNDEVNGSGATYVAYLFAHNAGGFGLTGTDNVISCGSFTTDGSGNATIDLGYEPQWVLMKSSSSSSSNWILADTMRGWTVDGAGGNANRQLYANTSDAEAGGTPANLNSTGFTFKSSYSGYFSTTFIYIAIRRGPMKVPTSGTSVFNSITRTGTGSTANITGAGFPPDMIWNRNRGGGYETDVNDKLRGAKLGLFTAYTQAETDLGGSGMTIIGQDGCTVATDGSYNANGGSFVLNFWRRAPSFFDEVCFTQSDYTQAYTHNLTVVPEMMIVKRRNNTSDWSVYSAALGNTKYLKLQDTGGEFTGGVWGNTSPTSTQFTFSGAGSPNTYVAYLFATCAGVSKVGSYTGTGTTKQVDCGFTGGARFVLIKRTDSTGDWYVWDSARGIVAGNDPYLLLNSTAAEVTSTDYVDTYSAGFEISSTAPAAINASGGTFIFLAIA